MLCLLLDTMPIKNSLEFYIVRYTVSSFMAKDLEKVDTV